MTGAPSSYLARSKQGLHVNPQKKTCGGGSYGMGLCLKRLHTRVLKISRL